MRLKGRLSIGSKLAIRQAGSFLAEWGMVGVGDYYCWADLATLRVCCVPCWRMAQETRPNKQPMRVDWEAIELYGQGR